MSARARRSPSQLRLVLLQGTARSHEDGIPKAKVKANVVLINQTKNLNRGISRSMIRKSVEVSTSMQLPNVGRQGSDGGTGD